MPKTDIFVGLEIGTSKTCMVVGEVRPDHSVRILGVGSTKSAGIRKGEILDMKQARTCLKQALHLAEEDADVNISSVLLSITGSHVSGFNHTGTFRLPLEEDSIEEKHIEEVREMAKDAQLPADHCLIHPISRHFTLDGKQQILNPVGMPGRTLDAECHIIHGIETRIQTSITAVREVPLEVDDIAFAPVASALAILNKEQKESGSLVIDIGGGTTDYALYLNGCIAASGCIPVGGDHVTNDIHLVEKIPLSRAEEVKINEGDATADPIRSVGRIRIHDEIGMIDLEIERHRLNQIIRSRLEETLRLILRQLPKDCLSEIGAGIFITGGGSKMRGFGPLVEEVFQLPVYLPDHHGISGVQNLLREPEFSTAIGLIRYAQFTHSDLNQRSSNRGLSGFFKKLFTFK